MGKRRFSLSLFIASLFPHPQKPLRTQAIFFTLRCSSLLPKGVGERRFALSLSLFIASLFSLPPETPENSGYFFTMGCSSLLPKGVGERRLPLSLHRFSIPPSPRNASELRLFFFTLGCSSLQKSPPFVWLTFGKRRYHFDATECLQTPHLSLSFCLCTF